MRSTLLCSTAVLCLSCLVMPLPLCAEVEYLREEQLALTFDLIENTSSLPLDPSHQYHVNIRSAYTMRPLLDAAETCSNTQNEEAVFFWTRRFTVRECHTQMPILVNGALVPTRPYASSRNAAYFIVIDTGEHYVPLLRLRLWGTGKPLSLKSTADFSGDIPSATASIMDLVYEQAQKNEADARRREEETRRSEQERQAMIQSGLKIGSGVLLVALVGCLCYGLVMRGSPAWDKRRVARLTREIQDELKRMEKMRRTF